MPKVTICIETNHPGTRAEVGQWLIRWKEALGDKLQNRGCGCCIDVYDIDAPWEAIRELPKDYFAYSDWAEWPKLGAEEIDE